MKFTKDIIDALEISEHEARRSLESSRTYLEEILALLSNYSLFVVDSINTIPKSKSNNLKATADTLEKKYKKYSKFLNDQINQFMDSISTEYANLERNAHFVTIMLFGRTKVGKSTTLEALSFGNGKSMGIGKQHTTKDVVPYYFPKNQSGSIPEKPCLRILDSPGIEGFKGDELTAKAAEHLHCSDHIFFVLSDDKAASGELDWFENIDAKGNKITVLLNIKTGVMDFDLLISEPKLIFKEKEINGHKRRIYSYLENNFNISKPHIIHFHALAAWKSRLKNKINNIVSLKKLEKNTRIFEVEKHILDFVANEAVYKRIKIARELLNEHLCNIRKKIEENKIQFDKDVSKNKKIKKEFEIGMKNATNAIKERFSELNQKFDSTCDGIPTLVDKLLSQKRVRRNLNLNWEKHLEKNGINNSVHWFTEKGVMEFREHMNEACQAVQSEFSIVDIESLDTFFDQYQEAKTVRQNSKLKRAIYRTSGTVVPSLLTIWAVTNFWNPSGWITAGAAAAVGIGSDMITTKISDEDEKKYKKNLSIKRNEIIKQLRDKVRNHQENVVNTCESWLQNTIDDLKSIKLNEINIINLINNNLLKNTENVINEIMKISDNINKELVQEIFSFIVPKIGNGKIYIKKVVRHPRRHTKVLLDTKYNKMSARSFCIGKKNKIKEKIELALGGGSLQLVDHKSSIETQILQALGIENLRDIKIEIDKKNKPNIVYIKAPGCYKEQIEGVEGLNLKLTSELLNLNVQLEEEN